MIEGLLVGIFIILLAIFIVLVLKMFNSEIKSERNEQRPAPPTTPSVKRTVVKNG